MRHWLSSVAHVPLFAFSGLDGRDLTDLVPHDATDRQAVHGHVLVPGPLVMIEQFLQAVGVRVCISTFSQHQSNKFFQEERNERACI